MLRRVKVFASLYQYESIDLEEVDYVVGVDKGAYELLLNGVKVDLAIGDFDSVNEEEFEVIKTKAKKIIKLNKEKDDTDLEHLFANYLSSDDLITCYGVLGQRLDHTYNNILLLSKYDNLNITYLDYQNKITLLKEGVNKIKKTNYKYFSIYAASNSILSLSSCKYPLAFHSLKVNDTLITSNEIENDEAIIKIKEGKVYLIETK